MKWNVNIKRINLPIDLATFTSWWWSIQWFSCVYSANDDFKASYLSAFSTGDTRYFMVVQELVYMYTSWQLHAGISAFGPCEEIFPGYSANFTSCFILILFSEHKHGKDFFWPCLSYHGRKTLSNLMKLCSQHKITVSRGGFCICLVWTKL